MDYTIEGHALRRIAQRKIPKHWVTLTIEHGESKDNYYRGTLISSISKDKCQELINELKAKLNGGKQIRKEIKSLKDLRDRGGIRVIYNPETKKVVTVFHKNETITAEFRVF